MERYVDILSLPTRECGLKSHLQEVLSDLIVTPYAGVWIEIFGALPVIVAVASLPTRECGLK